MNEPLVTTGLEMILIIGQVDELHSIATLNRIVSHGIDDL